MVTAGNLVRIGFRDGDRAVAGLRGLGEGAEPLAPLLARSADPDQALAGLLSLVDAVADPTDLVAALVDDEGTSMRLFSVLGMSLALGDHLRRHPEHWRELTDPTLGSTRPAAFAVRAGLMEAVGADPWATEPRRDARAPCGV